MLVNYLLYWMSACNTGGACRNSPFMQDRSPTTTTTAGAAPPRRRIPSLSSSSASKWTGRNQWGRKEEEAKKGTRCVRLKFNIRKLRFFYILRFFVSQDVVLLVLVLLFVPLLLLLRWQQIFFLFPSAGAFAPRLPLTGEDEDDAADGHSSAFVAAFECFFYSAPTPPHP